MRQYQNLGLTRPDKTEAKVEVNLRPERVERSQEKGQVTRSVKGKGDLAFDLQKQKTPQNAGFFYCVFYLIQFATGVERSGRNNNTSEW